MTMKISMMNRSLMVIGLAFAAGALGGCGRSEPTPANFQSNEALEAPITEDNASILPPPIDNISNVAAPTPPKAAKADPDEETQMHEDADAVGLTARMNQSEEIPVAGGNETGAQK